MPECSLPDHVLAREHGDKVTVLDGVTGERITYAELASQVALVAGGVRAAGFRPGDVVALRMHNGPRFPVAVHGVMAAGAAVALLNPDLTPDETQRLLDLSGATLLDELPQAEAELPPVDPASTAAILFSSGTTGATKPVRFTHRHLVANLEQTRAGWRVAENDVLAATLPFFHIYGFSIILNSGLLAGATLVTLPRVNIDVYLDTLENHHVTRAYLVPPVVAALAKAPKRHLPDLRYALCGAAPLDPVHRERAEETLGCLIRQGFGLTEAGGTHQVFDDDFASTDPESIGTLSPGTEARVVEPGTDSDAEVGELLVRGPQVSADGWLRTGDLVSVDEHSRFYVRDRIKEMIKYKAYQVAPAELEALLCRHPGVADVAVVGVPDAAAGEIPKAFVVAAHEVDPVELMRWAAERVAPYKKIRQVEFVDEIPRSVSGKILRRLLKERTCVS
ncbi:AMP-binding protein [Lentzea tibetensis]|uniref:AMP-binding protein n=1 Tax=Lentzea tibetensis TaxID=2591470 RepID=UPI001F1695F1|nr:AMP-binding protein [Lentzea tibetensis]